MNLLIDIGNTTIGLALYKNDHLVSKFFISTELDKVEDEYYLSFKNLTKDLNLDDIKNILISSVVPRLNIRIKNALFKLFKIEPKILALGFKTGMLIKIDNPIELGSDLVCDGVGGINKYESPMILVDLGTATKILVIDKNKQFIGCSIAPGILMSASTLTSKASQLMDIELSYPKNIIGKNTQDSLKSGIVIGHAEMIKGMCYQIEKELKMPLKKIFTGGNAYPIKDYLIKNGFIFDENLLFDGLNIILKKNI